MVLHPHIAFVVFKIFLGTRVSGPETEVSDGIICLGAFETLDSIGQTILGDTFIKASTMKLIWPNAEYGGYGIRREHNGQRAGEPIQNQGRAGLPLRWWHSELG
jgi:hypothetical protein